MKTLPVHVHALALACCTFIVGCGDDHASTSDAAVDADVPDAAVDPSDGLFRPDHVLEVAITLPPADWSVLRTQREDASSRTTCSHQPTTPGYTYFSAEITIDGVRIPNVGLRKKGGLGSLSATRPGLKVKANEYVSGQRIFGLKQITLNNNHQDPTLISQCLGYGLFRTAGLKASRCSFAHVVVNGDDLGVYSNVETIGGEFLDRNFIDGSGRLYESGGDFTPTATADFQPKTNSSAPNCGDLDPVVAALGAPDNQLVSQLGSVVDLDQYMRFWAMEVVTDHWDGYANNRNNAFFYHDPTSNRIQFLPWGIDALFTGRERTTRPYSVFACGSMAWRLYNAAPTRALYLAALRSVMADVWNETAILAEVDRMEALLTPIADPTHTGKLAGEIARVRIFIAGRKQKLKAEIDAGDPVWPYAADKSCLPKIGNLSSTFTSPWASLDQFGAGSGTMTGTVSSVALASSTVYASSGIASDGKATIQLFVPLADGRYAVVFIPADPAYFTVGAHPIDLSNVFALMVFYDPVTNKTSGGGLMLPGTLTLTTVNMTPGAPVVGSISGDIVEL